MPGLHCLNRRPQFDPDLFLFHVKTMDYSIASARQKINNDTAWSEASLSANFGAHHRYDFRQFVHENFFDPVNAINQNKLQPFDFTEEIAKLHEGTVERDGFYLFPMNLNRWVEVPANLRVAF
jgi:hypothetical protein